MPSLAEVYSEALRLVIWLPNREMSSLSDRTNYVYMLPPIVYPDGKAYVKIGGNREGIIDCERAEIENWFHSDGDAAIGEK